MFLQKIFTLLVIIGCAGMIAFSTATNSQAQGYSPSYKLLKAVRKKDYNEIRKLVRGGVNINTRDIDEGKTALYLAAETRDTQLIIYLLENKAKPDVPDRKSKETPLMVSARLGDIASVRSFIIAKADLDIQDITGQTALIKALQSRSSRILLIAHYAMNENIKSGFRSRRCGTRRLFGAYSFALCERKRTH